jgi:hypothetical protein
MNNATDLWREAVSGTACLTTVSTGEETCNGDNNGQIGAFSTPYEWFRF